MVCRVSLFLIHVAVTSGIAAADVGPSWRSLAGGVNGEVRALLVTSGTEAGGTGAPRLWAAGDFTRAGGVSVGRIASWNGGAWQSRGNFEYTVNALAEHAEAVGVPRVYAGGMFSVTVPVDIPDCVVSFDGAVWQPLTTHGYSLSWCNALSSVQMPLQPRKLMVSGVPQGVDPSYALFMGPSSWESIGGSFITLVDAAVLHDDGSGIELFTANGTFQGANKYNGSRRAALAGNCYQSPRCLVEWKPEGAAGAALLYMGGNLNSTANTPVNGVAKWNGASWSALGAPSAGVFKENGSTGWVHAMVPFDDGSGEKLWMVGLFASVGAPGNAISAQNIAGWNGSAWSVPSIGGVTGVPNDFSFINGIECAVVFDIDGPGGRPASMVVAGKFSHAGGVASPNIAVLDAAWCGPADVGRQGGVAKPDGRHDNNDFVAFIDLFFAAQPRADIGIQGGIPGTDGMFDNNDFVAFINLFFGGC